MEDSSNTIDPRRDIPVPKEGNQHKMSRKSPNTNMNLTKILPFVNDFDLKACCLDWTVSVLRKYHPGFWALWSLSRASFQMWGPTIPVPGFDSDTSPRSRAAATEFTIQIETLILRLSFSKSSYSCNEIHDSLSLRNENSTEIDSGVVQYSRSIGLR